MESPEDKKVSTLPPILTKDDKKQILSQTHEIAPASSKNEKNEESKEEQKVDENK